MDRIELDTKTRIYNAAIDLFYKHGYNGTSLRDICAAADVQMSSVYYHFENKQRLLYEVLKNASKDSTQLLRKRLAGVSGAEERLSAAISAHVEWHTTRQREAFISDAELPRLEAPYREEMLLLRNHHEQIFNEIIATGIDSGEFRDTKARLLTRMLLTGATGVSSWYSPNGEDDFTAIADVFADALVSGIRNSEQAAQLPLSRASLE